MLAATTSCEDYLEITPKTILVNDQVWSFNDLVISLLANLYNRIPVYATIYSNAGTNPTTYSSDAMSDNDELMWTGLYDDRNFFSTYAWNYQNYWDWNYIRDLNSFIENATAATKLDPARQKLFIAEGRFLRAYAYFEMVKRMGGVPLITKTYVYNDFVTDPDALKIPRSSEAAIYDFVASEVDILLNGTSRTSEHWALWPYRISAPTNPALHNKYIFVKKKAPRQSTYSRQFRLGNYYGEFSDTWISKNPMLIKNPNQ